MDWALAIVALTLLGVAAISRRLLGTPVTPATATTDAVSGAVDAIKSDLKQISDAQGDLNDERKQEVESANQEFSAQLETVAADLGSSLSASGAKAAVQSAGKELASSYQQTFAAIECD